MTPNPDTKRSRIDDPYNGMVCVIDFNLAAEGRRRIPTVFVPAKDVIVNHKPGEKTAENETGHEGSWKMEFYRGAEGKGEMEKGHRGQLYNDDNESALESFDHTDAGVMY